MFGHLQPPLRLFHPHINYALEIFPASTIPTLRLSGTQEHFSLIFGVERRERFWYMHVY